MKQSMRVLQHLSLLAAAVAAAPQAALAASATADAKFLGATVRETTGTATFTVTSLSVLEAFGTTTNGTADPGNNAMTFQSSFSLFGEGTATNGGFSSATSLATASGSAPNASGTVTSHALTWADIGVQLGGAGTVTVDFAFDLFVDAFDNSLFGFAVAGIEASASFSPLQTARLDLDGIDVTGFGADDALSGVLTLIFAFDDLGLGPIDDTVVIHTYASAQASPVPVPAAVWLLGSAVAGVAGYRRRAA